MIKMSSKRIGIMNSVLVLSLSFVFVAIVWAFAPPPYADFQRKIKQNILKADIQNITIKNFTASEENNGKLIRYSGKIFVNGYANDVGEYLRKNDLSLIPVVFYDAYYTYFERPVGSDGYFKGRWPIRSTRDRDFWVALFKTNGPVKPAQEPTAPYDLPDKMYAASPIKTF